MRRLPNILTLSRILAIPVIVGAFFLPGDTGNWIAFTVFTVAGITDFFDGYLARSMNVTSRLGKFLDPIADKLMVASVILMLVAFDHVTGLHILAAMVILLREILVSGLREFLADIRVSVPVTYLAKWKTTVQLVTLGALILGDAAPDWLPAELVGLVGLWIAALLTVYTGTGYLRTGLKHFT